MKRLLPLFLVILFFACGYTGDGAVWYYTDGMFTTANKPGTWRGLQETCDKATSTKRTEITLGPGIFEIDSTLWIHGNTTIRGSGMGKTILRRASFSASDGTNKGHVVGSAPYGKHEANLTNIGGIPKDSLANITLTDLTIDGNCTAWPATNPNIPGNFGLQFWHVDGVMLERVEVINTLQTGIELDNCKHASLSSIWIKNTGQQVNLGSRNGINLNNNSNSTIGYDYGWSRGFNLKDIHITNQRDTGIDISSCSDVTIDGVVMIRNQYDPVSNDPTQAVNDGFELEGNYTGAKMKNITINNVIATGLTGVLLTKGGTGVPLEGLKFSNVMWIAGDSSAYGGISLGANKGGVRDVDISNVTMLNINNKNVVGDCAPYCWAGGMYIDADNTSTDSIFNVNVSNVTIKFSHPETDHPSNDGVRIGGGKMRDVNFNNVKVYGAQGIGFRVIAESTLVSNVVLRDCYVDGSQREGFAVISSSRGGNSSYNGIKLLGCKAKDTNKAVAGYSFKVGSVVSGDVFKNIRIEGCEVVRTSGSNMQGLQLSAVAGSTVDSIWVLNNDFIKAAAPIYNVTGVVTHIFKADIAEGVGYGGGGGGISFGDSLENNQWIWWKNASSQYQPVIKVDSVNTLRFQPLNSSNLDFYRADGTLGARWSPGGAWNITNNGQYQLNGFRLLADSGAVRKYYMRSNGFTGDANNAGFVIRDSADTKNLFRLIVNPSTVVMDSATVNKRAVFLDSVRVNGTLRAQDIVTARIGAPAGTGTPPVGGGAIRIIDGVTYPFNSVGVGAAVTEISVSGGRVICPAGQYLFTAFVTIPSGVTIEGAGDSTVFVNASAGGADIFRVDGYNIALRNFRIDGLNGTRTAGAGINVLSASCAYVDIENITFRTTCDAGVQINGSNSYINVRNCRFIAPGDAGSAAGHAISASGPTFCRFMNNYIQNTKNDAISVTTGSALNNIISGNTIEQGRGSGIVVDGKFNTISNNNIYDVNVYGIQIDSDSSQVYGNTIARVNDDAIRTYGILGGNISNNIIANCTASGVNVKPDNGNTKGLVISDNNISNCTSYAIQVDPSTTRTDTDISILNNILMNNGGSVIVYDASAVTASTANIIGNVSEDAMTLSGVFWTYPKKANAPVYGEQSLDFDLMGANSYDDRTVAVTGAKVGAPVALGIPTTAIVPDVTYTAWCNATNQVTIRAIRACGTTPNPGSGTFTVQVY